MVMMLSCRCCFCNHLFKDVDEKEFFEHWQSCGLGILSIDVFDFYYLSKCLYESDETRCPHFVMNDLKTEGYIAHHQWHVASITSNSSYIMVYKCDKCQSTFSTKQCFSNHLKKTNKLNRCSKYQKQKTPYHSVVKFDLNLPKLEVIARDTDIASLNASMDAIKSLAYSVTKVTDKCGNRGIQYSCKKCKFPAISKNSIMSHLRKSHSINYGNKKSKFGDCDANGDSKNKGKRKREKLINQSTRNENEIVIEPRNVDFHGNDEPPQKKRKKLARKNNKSDKKNEKSDLSMKSQLVLSMTTSPVVPPSLTNNVKHKREKCDSNGSIVNEALFVKKRKTTDATSTNEDSKIDLMENEDESSMTVIGRSGTGSIHSMISNQKRKARQNHDRNGSVLSTMSTFGNYDASDATGLSTNLNNNNNNNHNNNSSHNNSNRSSQSNISENGQRKMKKSQSKLRRYKLTRTKTDNIHKKKKWEDDDSDDETTNDEFESNNMKELPKERMNIWRHHSVDNTNVNRNTNASTNTSNNDLKNYQIVKLTEKEGIDRKSENGLISFEKSYLGQRKGRSFNREEKRRIHDNGDINTSHQFGMTIGNDLTPRSQSKSQSTKLNNNTISNYFSNMKSFNRKEKRRMCDNGNINTSNESGLSLQSQGATSAQAMKSPMKSPMRQHSESEGPSIDNDLTLQSQSKSQSNDFRNNIDNNINNNSTNNNDDNDTNGKMTTSKTVARNRNQDDDEDDTEYEDTMLPLTHGSNHRGLYMQRVPSQTPQLSDTASKKERHPLKLGTPSLNKNNQSSFQSHVTYSDNENATQLSKLKIHRKNRVSTPQHGSRQSPMTNTTGGTNISSCGYKVGPNLPTPIVETPLFTVSGQSKTSNNNAQTPTLGARIGRSISSYIHGNKQNDSNNNNLKNENNDNKTDSKIENGNHLNQSDHTASTGGTTVTGTTLNNATLIVYDNDCKDLQSRQSRNNSIKTKISKKVESSGNDNQNSSSKDNDINISLISGSKHSMVDDMRGETDDEMNEAMDVSLPPAKMQSYEPPIGNDNARNYGSRHNNNDNGKNNILSSTEHIFCNHNSGGSNRIEATQSIDKSLKIGNNNNRKKCGLPPATIAAIETTKNKIESDSNIKLDSVKVVIDKNKMMPQHDTVAGNGGCQVGPDLPISKSIIDSEYSAILSNFDESRNDSLDLTSINNDENAWGPEREEEDDEEQDVDVENGGERKITMQDSRMKIAGSGNTGWNIGTSQDCMGICFAGNCNMQGGSRYMPKGRVGKKQKSNKKQLNDMSNIISFNNNNDNNSNFGNGKSSPIGINGEQLKQLWKQLKDEMKKDQGSNCGETPSININVYNYMDMANANLSNGAGIAMNCDGNINNEQRVKMGNIMSHNNRYEMGENSSNVKIDDHSVKISGKGAAAYTMSTKQDVMSGVNQFGNIRQHRQTVNWSE